MTVQRSNFALASCATALLLAAPALALDEVKFGTNWLAEAEHGGFYQAVADGTYEKYGLDVTIVQGGPQAANQALLMADKVQFYMRGNLVGSISAIEQDIPVMEVAAILPEGSAGYDRPCQTRRPRPLAIWLKRRQSFWVRISSLPDSSG